MSFPDFATFYRHVSGHEPYPWQVRLASFAVRGEWPDAIDIPTGLGKTATLAIAVHAVAKQVHDGGPRTTPQRIIHVVDRRPVVDQTHIHLETISRRLGAGDELAPLRESLRQLAGPWSLHGEPLVVQGIHGASSDNRGWLRPTGACVVTMTPHQLVSRLLFRGYGVSARTRSLHAGLLGVDALIVFDEPHLSEQAIATVTAVLKLQAAAQVDLGLPASRLVLLGATMPGASEGLGHGFGLDEADREHPDLLRVLRAGRSVRLVQGSTSESAVASALVKAYEQQRRDLGADGRIAVIVNTVRMAQTVRERLLRPGPRVEGSEPEPIHLVTSRMRPYDRRRAVEALTGCGGALAVVATQSLEVGVDVSFDGLVTEACPYPSLVQRLGRLNRDGLNPDAQADVVVGKDAGAVRKGTEAVYGVAPVEATTRMLSRLEVDGKVDLSLERQVQLKARQEIGQDLWPLAPRVATFHGGYLGVMTTTYPTPWSDIPVDSFVSGPDVEGLDVLVAWRSDLGVLESCPPRSAEQVSVPLTALRAMLSGEAAVQVADVERGGAGEETGGSAHTTDFVGMALGDDNTWREVSAAELAPGDVVVLKCSSGGYTTEAGWSPTSSGDVPDVSLVVALGAGPGVRFPVSRETIAPWLKHPAKEGDVPAAGEPADAFLRAVDQVLARLQELTVDEIRSELALVAPEGLGVSAWDFDVSVDDAQHTCLVAWRRRDPSRTAAPDHSHRLDQHQEQVRIHVCLASQAAGLVDDVAKDVASAARWHDQGKRDHRFQAYLGNSNDAEPWAKSRRGRVAPEADRRIAERCGLPRGWRHEGLSAELCAEAGMPELVVHLVASHHGRSRPLLQASLAGRGQGERSDRIESFEGLNATWGAWGLAYLEAMLRLSDWIASAHPDHSAIAEALPSAGPRAETRGAPTEPQRQRVLTGLVPTPLTGWFAVAGLLRVAYALDPRVTIHWPQGGNLPPAAPVWCSPVSLEDVCEALLRSGQWSDLAARGSALGDELVIKHQKVRLAAGLGVALRAAWEEGGWLATGLLQDAAPVIKDTKGRPDRLALTLPAYANNASFVRTAIDALAGSPGAGSLVSCLLDPLSGWSEAKCDGGMDRQVIDDGVTGREVKDHRMIRTHLAPAALLGMASMGSVGVSGLGVRRRELRVPLPTEPVTWPELVARTHAVALEKGWVLRYRPVKTTPYESLWFGRAEVGRPARS